eukprot:INCI5720.1.p1 GENE.INCI5720.1~~INCI5720.1.p1  ORF type:complete len:275 (-),score=37.98 INCI5720.1:192-1016(-)
MGKRGAADISGVADDPMPPKRKQRVHRIKESFQRHVSNFAETVDALANKTADFVTGGATAHYKHRIMANMLAGFSAPRASDENEDESFPDTSPNNDDLAADWYGNQGFGSSQQDETEPPEGTSGSGAGIGLLFRNLRKNTAPPDEDSDDTESSDDDDSEMTTKVADGPRLRNRRPLNSNARSNPNDESRPPPQDDTLNPIDSPEDMRLDAMANPLGYSSGVKGYGQSYGAFCLACSLAVCWAIILLAIPLLPIIIASWLLSDIVQHNVVGYFNS